MQIHINETHSDYTAHTRAALAAALHAAETDSETAQRAADYCTERADSPLIDSAPAAIVAMFRASAAVRDIRRALSSLTE